MRILKLSILLAALFGGSSPSSAGCVIGGDVWGGVCGGAAPSYQGPGDVVSGALIWGSCARAYSSAQASTAISFCDLVASGFPTVTLFTLRGSSAGIVDLSAYFPGSVTPAAKCATATGAVCNI